MGKNTTTVDHYKTGKPTKGTVVRTHSNDTVSVLKTETGRYEAYPTTALKNGGAK